MGNIAKLQAAYKTGFLGENILDTYFSFFANIILDKKIRVIEANQIAQMFWERYAINLPLPFVRQVLGVGVQNGSIIMDHGKYSVCIEELDKYRFNKRDFDNNWNKLIFSFEEFCIENMIDIPHQGIEEFVLEVIDYSDDVILSDDKADEYTGMKPIEFAWYSFVKDCSEHSPDLFDFITAVCASNIAKQALFYAGDNVPDYSDLHVYLDSPMIFALLGMDTKERMESYKLLIADMKRLGCNIHVLDNHFQEIEGIIARASSWAVSTQYDIRKANNAARFFHDNQMSALDITDFCANIETELNSLGITVKKTSYDVYQNQFQEDEEKLFEMIKERYKEQELLLNPEKENSIQVDVRAIVMIYRERQGQTATKIENSKHLLLTTNNAVANVSKKYESNCSNKAGHIPPCISVDLFGAILWLSSPVEMMNYQRKKLLADCFDFLKPDRVLVDKYIKSLEEARRADEIDEKKFLFLRTHPVVLDALMNITRGDYARFDQFTYLEVYDEIVSKSKKEYADEVKLHQETKNLLGEERDKNKRLEERINDIISENRENDKKHNNEIKSLRNELDKMKEREFEGKVRTLGWMKTICLFGIPYIVIVAIIDILKARFANISAVAIVGNGVLILASILAVCLFNKGKEWCFSKTREKLVKTCKKNDGKACE